MPDSLINASAWIIPVVLAIMLHEVAHGWVAEKFGDPTARVMGRITLNPIKHVDWFGTVLFPAIMVFISSPLLFGYAKPVPVNFTLLNPPRLGMAVVALAGPVTNIILALITGVLLHIETLVTPEQSPWVFLNLYRSLMINCGLVVFNMLPIMPLDGGRVVYALLPGKARRIFGKTERRGILLVFALLLGLHLAGVDLNQVLGVPVFYLMKLVMLITGNGG